MEKPELYPLKFGIIYKHYIWGGRNLENIGKVINNNEIVAESWEISDHEEDVSIVKSGALAGRSLRDLVGLYGENICAETGTARFPLLIKYLDANKRLSVQVHPDDEYTRAHESPTEPGKNECWFIMEASPGAELIMGIKKGVTKKAFEQLINENKITEGLNRVPVSKGDFIHIKTGTVHALLEGIMVCEIQQNSDTTYRLYDWGRKGQDGKPRPLHIQKALDVINFPSGSGYEKYMKDIVISYDKSSINTAHSLIRGKYFNIDYLHYEKGFELSLGEYHFHTLNILNGNGIIIYSEGTVPIQKGETILIPRPVQSYIINTGGIEILKAFL